MGKRHHLRRTTDPFSCRQLARLARNGALGRLAELVNSHGASSFRNTAFSEKCNGEVIRKITRPRPTSRPPNEAMRYEGKSYN